VIDLWPQYSELLEYERKFSIIDPNIRQCSYEVGDEQDYLPWRKKIYDCMDATAADGECMAIFYSFVGLGCLETKHIHFRFTSLQRTKSSSLKYTWVSWASSPTTAPAQNTDETSYDWKGKSVATLGRTMPRAKRIQVYLLMKPPGHKVGNFRGFVRREWTEDLQHPKSCWTDEISIEIQWYGFASNASTTAQKLIIEFKAVRLGMFGSIGSGKSRVHSPERLLILDYPTETLVSNN
jgi:hypothetical protein